MNGWDKGRGGGEKRMGAEELASSFLPLMEEKEAKEDQGPTGAGEVCRVRRNLIVS